ncbi:MAG: response regulator transcription factor [Cyanothece sp. SIO1E1]|nr:response regulator transcription factor [Cyanothece sp. SIO1E1]
MPKTPDLSPIRVLIVEDHALMRRGLIGQFSLESAFEVVGEAENGEQGVQLATELHPDLVLMDIEMPVIGGITATQQIKSTQADIRVLALSAFGNDNQVVGMLAAGADGYCLKDIEWSQLLVVMQLVQAGGTYLDPQIAHKVATLLQSTTHPVAATIPESEPSTASVLSEREREVLQLISEGLSNQAIADQLHLSLGTIKSYVRAILNKLSVDDRVQAAAKAVREGLI